MKKSRSAVHSGFFSLANQSALILINFGTLAVLGRLLKPEDFGLFAIVLASQALFLPLLDFGLTPVYIKIDRLTKETPNVFFTINIIIGLVNVLYLVVIAPP